MNILLVDDDPFNREGVKLYLEQRGCQVVEAGDAQTAWEIAQTSTFDAAVIDIVIPEKPNERFQVDHGNGVKLTARLKDAHPSLGIVLFSAYEGFGQDVFRLIQEGKRGIAYKLKGCRPRELYDSLLLVKNGQIAIDAEVTAERSSARAYLSFLEADERNWVILAAKRIPELSPREYEIAQLISSAHISANIAESLALAPKSVDNVRNRIYQKLGLSELEGSVPPLSKPILLAKAFILHELQSASLAKIF